MSRHIIELGQIVPSQGDCRGVGSGRRRKCRGVGMLEVLVALLLFSTAVLGLLSTQLLSLSANHSALQRSIAVALGRDILERIRSNAAKAQSYQVVGAGVAGRGLKAPNVDCDTAKCSSGQLVIHDLWQWELLLHGVPDTVSGKLTGGLHTPIACIFYKKGRVDVAISWWDAMPLARTALLLCDESNSDSASHGARREILLTTYVEAA